MQNNSPEQSIVERPTEEGRKGGEAVCTPQTSGREPGWWRGSLPGKAEPPEVWLAKAEGPDCVSSDSQQDLTSGMLKVNSSLSESGKGEDARRESC